jgi:hypothetical protein
LYTFSISIFCVGAVTILVGGTDEIGVVGQGIVVVFAGKGGADETGVDVIFTEKGGADVVFDRKGGVDVVFAGKGGADIVLLEKEE